ncbi:MAG: Carbonate dehydratase [Rickettsiaceae bacterium]|jgi:carbonic anhydrase|nr:Carbonate dehydratase [Rickettsiaceae bacterium]
MADFGKLISGFRLFKATTYKERKEVIGHLQKLGVKPKTLVITCADLWVAPDILFSSNPGDSFVFRNIGGFVPPFGEKGIGLLAAVEYSVCTLNVETIVVMGHSHCDFIKMLMDENAQATVTPAMSSWFEIVTMARDAVKKALAKKTAEEQQAACEHETILVSMRNLISYPFVQERINDGRLKIYGWYFDMEEGVLQGFDPKTKFFEPIG